MLCQLAADQGTTVIGVTSSEVKEAAVRKAGAAHVMSYDNFADRVRELTGGVDAVYDSVGNATFAGSLACLRPRGTLVLYGQSSGSVDGFDPHQLAVGSLYLTRPMLSHYNTTPERMRDRAATLFGMLREGRLTFAVHATYPLEEASRAHLALGSRQTIGKVLLAAGA